MCDRIRHSRLVRHGGIDFVRYNPTRPQFTDILHSKAVSFKRACFDLTCSRVDLAEDNVPFENGVVSDGGVFDFAVLKSASGDAHFARICGTAVFSGTENLIWHKASWVLYSGPWHWQTYYNCR